MRTNPHASFESHILFGMVAKDFKQRHDKTAHNDSQNIVNAKFGKVITSHIIVNLPPN